jgi:poly-gamma-glutamate capsule biosynthesis protein CapA/YwtB (metallophosphatase superfamily)
MVAREGTTLFSKSNPWQQVNAAIKQQQNGAQQAFFFANLESPIYNADKTHIEIKTDGYDLCAGVDQLSILKQGGITLVNLANNHEADCGKSSTADIRELVEQAGFGTVGPDLIPTYLDTRAGKIGLLAAEDVTQKLDENKLLEAIKSIRAGCDILIVSLHWGNEYQSGISPRQQVLAQTLADAGVDVLWGTHPHVLQKMEWISSKNGDHQMLAMYSLGNLLADQWMMDQTQQSALVTLQLQGKKIIKLSVLPMQMDRSSEQLMLPNNNVMQKIEDQLGVSGLSGTNVRLSVP